MAKKNNANIKSTKHQYPIEGAWGIMLQGPLSLCGKEDRGGVAICMMKSDGREDCGGTMMREHVIDMHHRLGQWIEMWKAEDAK